MALTQNPLASVGKNTVSLLIVFRACCFSKPNLSVILIDCTSNMSSVAALVVVSLRVLNSVLFTDLLRRPNEANVLDSPPNGSWSHWTGSQVGIHGVTKARNCTMSEDGNLKASKYEVKSLPVSSLFKIGPMMN
jgi:hypothetical protein